MRGQESLNSPKNHYLGKIGTLYCAVHTKRWGETGRAVPGPPPPPPGTPQRCGSPDLAGPAHNTRTPPLTGQASTQHRSVCWIATSRQPPVSTSGAQKRSEVRGGEGGGGAGEGKSVLVILCCRSQTRGESGQGQRPTMVLLGHRRRSTDCMFCQYGDACLQCQLYWVEVTFSTTAKHNSVNCIVRF